MRRAVLLVAILWATPTPAFAQIGSNLQACWALESDGTDSAGSNTLTANNAPSFTTAKVGNGVDLEASSSQSLSVADSTLASPGNTDFTFAFWVNFESLADGTFVLAKGDGSDGEFYVSVADSGGLHFRFVVLDAAGYGSQGEILATTHGTLSTSTWYFVVVRHNASADTVSVQINDGTVDSAAHSTGAYDSGAVFSIGQIPGFGGFTDGLVDQVAYWGSVLSSGDATALYNSGNGVSCAAIIGGGGGSTGAGARRMFLLGVGGGQ